jgi:flavin reductase (DIM6/NTAB) family NADH-FMN oxidoreductase RutF
MKISKGPTTLLFPCPVALITCGNVEGRDNIITLAWIGVSCSDPPTIGIGVRPSRYSKELIERSGEFVVNIPTEDLVARTDFCGMVSGRDVDKWEATGFTREPAKRVRAPMIRECPVNLECVLKESVNLGSHRLYLGEVVDTHIDEGVLNEKGLIDYAKATPFVYNAREYWNLGRRIGTYGFAKDTKEFAGELR